MNLSDLTKSQFLLEYVLLNLRGLSHLAGNSDDLVRIRIGQLLLEVGRKKDLQAAASTSMSYWSTGIQMLQAPLMR